MFDCTLALVIFCLTRSAAGSVTPVLVNARCVLAGLLTLWLLARLSP